MKIKLVLLAGLTLLFIGCNFWTNSKEETIIEGKTNLLVDETLLPIVEAQTQIFESKYPAKLGDLFKLNNSRLHMFPVS